MVKSLPFFILAFARSSRPPALSWLPSSAHSSDRPRNKNVLRFQRLLPFLIMIPWTAGFVGGGGRARPAASARPRSQRAFSANDAQRNLWRKPSSTTWKSWRPGSSTSSKAAPSNKTFASLSNRLAREYRSSPVRSTTCRFDQPSFPRRNSKPSMIASPRVAFGDASSQAQNMAARGLARKAALARLARAFSRLQGDGGAGRDDFPELVLSVLDGATRATTRCSATRSTPRTWTATAPRT
mmetsp:Transcript_14690/g.45516  ORF Transcript_14690/g.45516 Transcript_14690/m.45516 type:complete len:240 (-) Transcript_14690:447-1166(-)